MKKILIISYYYKHKNAMASVRTIKLAKYLSRLGNKVTVLTSKQKDTWTKEYNNPVLDNSIQEIYAPQIMRWSLIQKYLGHRRKMGQNRLANAKKSTIQNTSMQSMQEKISIKRKVKKRISWFFYFTLAKQEDLCMYRGLKKETIRQGLGEYDVVISTYPTYGAFLAGMWMKKSGRCKSFIADFRDPLYNPGFRNKRSEADYDLKCLQSVLNSADQVVCVSEGIANGISEAYPHYSKPITIIRNGFDVEDAPVANEERNNDGYIHFVYTGTLYHGKRCVDMLCIALQTLIMEGRIKKDSFVFEYAGPDYQELENQLQAYGMEDRAVDYGFISREKAVKLQQKADALILLTWNEKTYQGVVPGKLFEYMCGGSIPIIALITGDTPNSEVARIIRESDCGIACEESVMSDLDRLTEFIYALMSGTLILKRNVEQYDYKNIAEQYEKLIGEGGYND